MSKALTPEGVVYDIKSLGSAIVSPEGTSIVYAVSQTYRESGKAVSNLWLCDLDGGNQRQITRNGATNGDPAWSPDGSSLAYVSRRDGDHPGAIVTLPRDGGESRIITRHASSPSSVDWSPDGTSLAYVVEVDPDNPDETPTEAGSPPPVIVVDRLDYKLDGRGLFNRKRKQVHIVDIESGERRRITGPDVAHAIPRWSPDGKLIACIAGKPDSPESTIVLIDPSTGKQVAGSGNSGYASNLWWLPDGTGLLYLGDPLRTSHPDFHRFDLASGATRPLTENVEFLPDIGYQNTSTPGEPVWLDDNKAIVHGLLKGASGLWVLDLESGGIQELVRWQAMHGGLSATPDKTRIVQSRSSMVGTGNLVTWDRATGETTTIVSLNDEFFGQSPTAAWESLGIERAGLQIEGWLLRPNDFSPEKQYPLVLSVHGGPHNAYGYMFDVVAQILATNGYLVLMVNPRGSGTYGKHFAEAVHGDWGGEDWADLTAMLDLVCERSYVDAKRIGIYGYSYGGYMTAWAIGQTDRFAAAICGAPVYDMISMMGTSDIGFFFTPNQMKADPVKDRARLIERSPATWGHRATTPTLIIQGEADDRCPVGQAEQMFVDLKMAGCETQLVRYPGGSHLMLKLSHAAHRIDYLERVLDWFDRHLERLPTTGSCNPCGCSSLSRTSP